MSDKSATGHAAPHNPRKSQPPPPSRDTLAAIDQLFLRDQLKALLASPSLSRGATSHRAVSDEPKEDSDELAEQDTEPNLDVQLLRAALGAKL